MEHGARPKIKMKNSGLLRVKKYPKLQSNKHKCSTYNLFHLDKLDKLIEYSHLDFICCCTIKLLVYGTSGSVHKEITAVKITLLE